MESRRARLLVVWVPVAIGAAALALHGPIPQERTYHRFADQRTVLAIPRAGDVFSNAALAAAGALGLAFLASRRSRWSFLDPRERAPYVVFFAAVLLAAFGSTYYHLAPDNDRLFWDRLPMTLAFTSLFVAVLGERADIRLAIRLLTPLLVVGAGSILYWRWTEAAGRGDLRPYALVQYGLVVAIGLLLLLFPARYTHSGFFWAMAAAYGAAKAFELLDAPILQLTGFVSGHTLKHVLAGAAAGLVLAMLTRRRPKAAEGAHE